MPDFHTTETFAALTDAQKDAAIAGALGWTHHCPPLHEPGGSEPWWQRPGRSSRYGAPPPYFTGGDADPYANWHLLAEVAELLVGVTSLHIEHTWRALRIATLDRDCALEAWHVGRSVTGMAKGEYHHAPTPHRAACLALVAGGLVPKEDSS